MKKTIITGIVASMLIILSGCGSKQLDIKDTYTVELGDMISIDAKTYLPKDVKKDVLQNTDITFKTNKAYKEETKEKALVPVTGTYLPVGKYEATAKYKKEKKDFTVEVKDTVAPKFVDFKKKIKIEQNAKDVKLESYFKAEDLSETKITTKGEVKLEKTGKYEISVTATDKYKNATTNKATIEVVSMETAESEGVSETTEGTKPISNELATKKEQAVKEQQQAEEQEIANQQQTNPAPVVTPPVTNNQGGATTPTPDPTPTPEPTPEPTPTPDPIPTPDPEPTPPANTCSFLDVGIGNSGMVFSTWAEAEAWASSELMSETGPYGWNSNYRGYSGINHGCNEDGTARYSIDFY